MSSKHAFIDFSCTSKSSAWILSGCAKFIAQFSPFVAVLLRVALLVNIKPRARSIDVAGGSLCDLQHDCQF
jgi:hypothetical protein